MPRSTKPETITLTVPEALGKVEPVAMFMGFSKGGGIEPTSGEAKLTIGVPFEHKYEALKATDRPGAMLYFVVLASVRPEFGEEGE